MFDILISSISHHPGPPPDFSSGVTGSFPNFELPFEPVAPIMSDGSLSSPAQGESHTI